VTIPKYRLIRRYFGSQIIRKPGSVLADYLSRLTVASELQRFF
jgi:hypothetical protein